MDRTAPTDATALGLREVELVKQRRLVGEQLAGFSVSKRYWAIILFVDVRISGSSELSVVGGI